jgi:DNA-directed RNA polymerase subunit RPC12/RpoP
MSRKEENTGFICQNCGRAVFPLDNGGYRNHCPFCLFSRHVDKAPGDRREACGGLMQPAGLRYKPGKGYQIIHRCLQCGAERANKAAVDTIQPDDIEAIAAIML